MDWSKVVFLAHAVEDKPFVKRLYEQLKAHGLEPWLDEYQLAPGVRWDDKIREAIQKARFFVACISSNSVSKSGYVQRELRTALSELEKKAPDVIYFIPALIEDVEVPNINVGTISLRDYHAAKIFDEEGLQKLIGQLKKQANVTDSPTTDEQVESTNVNPEPANPGDASFFQDVKMTIAKGRVKGALDMLQQYAEAQGDYMINEILLLTSRYNNLRKESMMGTISREEANLGNNRIVYAMLELIKELEKNQGSSM